MKGRTKDQGERALEGTLSALAAEYGIDVAPDGQDEAEAEVGASSVSAAPLRPTAPVPDRHVSFDPEHAERVARLLPVFQIKEPLHAFDVDACVSIDERGGIGHRGRVPWGRGSDFAQVGQVVRGRAIICGGATAFDLRESGFDLRECLLITISRAGVAGFDAMPRAISTAIRLGMSPLIFGGQDALEAGIKYATRLFLTDVRGQYPADRYLNVNRSQFRWASFAATGRGRTNLGVRVTGWANPLEAEGAVPVTDFEIARANRLIRRAPIPEVLQRGH